MKSRPALVIVEWLDSFGCSSQWQEIGECQPSPLRCHSVGWLVYDGEDCKVVVPHMSDPEHAYAKWQGCGDMTIPTRAIVSIKKMQAPKRGPAKG